ncbi:hypothetical protein HOE04_00060 [archaeon]|jgi:hypothetical protein|nr:hypothetical protein [archaeon]
METRYLRVGYEKALSTRKELLSAELNSININKKLKQYRELRKKEFFLKNKLRIALGNLKIKTNLILSTLPKEKKEIPEIKERKKNKVDKDITNELEAISKKLAELGN